MHARAAHRACAHHLLILFDAIYKMRFLVPLCLLFAISFTVLDGASPAFRSDKMNYIYQKALQHINDKKRLGKLEGELQTFDNIYMDAKKKDGEGTDMRKEYTRIDDKLRTLLEKYDLQQAIDAFKTKKKLRNENEMQSDNLVFSSEKFTDPKLQKLWNAAETAKFGAEELKSLHGELKEAERRMAAYNDILQEFNKVPHENSIHHDDHTVLDERNQRLKAAHREMYEHLDAVHKKITNEEYSPFEDSKVKKLWATVSVQAQASANLTAHDLDILKEELLHFDKQLKKLQFHKEELKTVKELAEKAGKGTLQNLEHSELEAKHERMSRKLKKLESYIQRKVRHSEL